MKQLPWRIRRKIQQFLAGILVVVMTVTSVPIPTFAESEYANYLAGWKVMCAWSNLSADYEWNAATDQMRQPKLIITYRLEHASRDFAPGDITITIPGIGNAYRDSVLKADKLVTDSADSEWDLTWDKMTDTYVYTNKFEVKENESVNGGLEMMYTFQSRENVNDYVQELVPEFSVNGEGRILMPPLTYSFTSVRDRYRIDMTKDKITAEEYDASDKSFVWYEIETRFDKDWKSRGVYKSSYYVTIDLPDGEDYADVIVKNGTKTYTLTEDENGEWGFYPFRDRRGDIGTRYSTYYDTFTVGFLKESLKDTEVTIHGHLDRLYQDESEWVTEAGENEVVDDELTFTVDDYAFTHEGYIYDHNKTGQYSSSTPYPSRLNAVNLYNGKVVQFQLTGRANRSYASTFSLKNRRMMAVNEEPVATPSDATPSNAADTTNETEEIFLEDGFPALPEGIEDWNNIHWKEDGLGVGDAIETNQTGSGDEDDDGWGIFDLINDLFGSAKETVSGLGEQLLMTAYAATPSVPEEEQEGNDITPSIPDDDTAGTEGEPDPEEDMDIPALFIGTKGNPVATYPGGNTSGLSQIGEEQEYSLVLGDDKLAVFLEDGSMRALEDEEYDIAYVTVPAASRSYDYEVYGAATQDTHFDNYVFLGEGNTGTKSTVLLPEGVKAVFVKVNGITGSFSYDAYVGVRFHLDWESEQAKPEGTRISHENKVVNFSYLRALYLTEEDGLLYEVNDCALSEDEYLGSYGLGLADRDLAVYREQMMRDYSNVYLRSPVTKVSAGTTVGTFNGGGKDGFTTTVTSSGTISADNEGPLERFSLYSVLPDGFLVDMDEGDITLTGSAKDQAGNEVTDFLDHAEIRLAEYNGKQMIAVDVDYSLRPLAISEGVTLRISYPASLSYADYLGYGNTYTVNTYVLVQDAGTDKVSGSAVMTDQYDIDEDGDISEKMAFSSDTETAMDDVSEWREFVSKYVKSAYSDGYVTDTVTRLYNSSEPVDVQEKSQYSYRLDFGLGSSNAKEIVFFDAIEQGASIAVNETEGVYEEIPSEWQGTLVSVDTSHAESQGMVPTVYYSMDAAQVFELTDPGWMTEAPADLSQVRAVAIHLDISALDDGMLKTKQMTHITLHMQAPEDAALADKKAVNQYTVQYDAYGIDGGFDTTYTLPSAETYVTLYDSVGKLTIQKVDLDNQTGVDKDGNPKYAPLTGARFQVYDNYDSPLLGPEGKEVNSLGQIVIKNLPHGTYFYEELEAPAGYEKINGQKPFVIDELHEVLTVGNKRIPGSVSLTKEDGSDSSYGPLAGAVYELYTADGIQVFTDDQYAYDENGINGVFVTGIDGRLTVTSLPWNSYYFVETEAPDGYELDPEPIPFTISRSVQEVPVTGINTQIPALVQFVKKDAENGAVLKDAYYDVFKEQEDGTFKKIKENLKTNAAGEIYIENLYFGSYEFREVQPPKGYLLNPDPVPFVLDAETAGTVVEVEQTDARKTGSARLHKTSEDGMPLAGAVYGLFKDGEETPVAGNLVTGADGFTDLVDDLTWSDGYYFKELSAPKGYELDEGEIRFGVNAGNTDITQTIYASDKRMQGSVKLTKMDEKTKSLYLEGAEFALYKTDGTLVRDGLVTGNDGTVVIENIDWGSFYLQEKTAPQGFVLSEEKIRFSVNQENCHLTQEVTCYNKEATGSITIEKEILGGERYQPFGSTSFTFVVKGTNSVTGEDLSWHRQIVIGEGQESGTAVISDVPYGTYVIREISNSRYGVSEVTVGSSNVTVSETGAVVNLSNDEAANVIFTNDLTHYEKDSQMAEAANIVTKGRKLTGISVEYKGDTRIESDTEAEYTFTAADLAVIAFYDDGTTKEIPFEELTLDPATVTGNQNTSGSGYTVHVSYEENGIKKRGSFSVEINLQIPKVPHTITYDANGGYFGDDTSKTINEVTYEWRTVHYDATAEVKTVHSSNVNEDGTLKEGYKNRVTETMTVSIPGAESLKVTVQYSTENVKYDYVQIRKNDANGEEIAKLGGGKGTSPTGNETYTITDTDTLYFYFTSDGSDSGYFGYHATIEGTRPERDENKNVPITGTEQQAEHRNYMLVGWCTDKEYSSETLVNMEELLLKELVQDIKLYAVWREPDAVFDTGSNVNIAMKSLAKGSNITDYTTTDTLIQAILKSEVSPDLDAITYRIVSVSTSEVPIYMWYEDGTIYWWSKDPSPKLNKESDYLFYRVKKLSNISGLSSMDTSTVTGVSSMFYQCNNLQNIDALSNWDTSKITFMYRMFDETDLINIDALSNWDTSKVINMQSMFGGCDKLTNLAALSTWNTSKVTDMKYMFSYCKGITNVDEISNWNTCSLRDAEYMFSYCTNLTNLDGLSNWDTSSVTSLSYMFQNCTNLTNLDGLSNWDTSSVTSLSFTFTNCRKLSSLEGLADWNTQSVAYMSGLFDGCSSIMNLDELSRWDTSSVTSGTYLFRNCYNLTNLNSLSNWNTSSMTTMEKMFYNCNSISDVIGLSNWNTSSVTNMDYMFDSCDNLTNFDGLSNWNTSSVKSMNYMFENCTNLTNLNSLCNWDTSAVMSMSYMFYYCTGLTNVNGLTNWDTSAVTNMSYMFYGCTGLTNVNGLTNWDTSNVTTIYNMFRGCKNITRFDLSGWILSSSVNKDSTFYGCSNVTEAYAGSQQMAILLNAALPASFNWMFIVKEDIEQKPYLQNGILFNKNIPDNTTSIVFTDITAPDNASVMDVSHYQDNSVVAWMEDTVFYVSSQNEGSKVIANRNMTKMFYNELKLESIDAKLLDTTFVTSMNNLFGFCRSLTTIDGLSSWITSSVNDMSYLFYVCNSLTNIDGLSIWNTSSVKNMSFMFYDCYILDNIDELFDWETSSVTNTSSMFYGCSNLANVDGLSNLDTSSVTNMSSMFYGCSNLANVDGLSNLDTSSVTNMSYMFSGCSSLTNINALSNWNQSKVTDMSGMFRDCSSLTNIDALSNWDTSKVTDMSGMFHGCSSLTNIDALSNWDTSKVTDMSGMFLECSISNVDSLVNWNSGSVKNMADMFYECKKLGNVDGLRNWNTSNVKDMSRIFYYCSSIKNVDGLIDWDTSSVTTLYRMFYYCTSLINIDGFSKWNTSKLITMQEMFRHCTVLANVDGLCNWNTSSLYSIHGLFYECHRLSNMNGLNNWDISNISNFLYMCYECPTRPTFNQPGTWDAQGTFVPGQ